MVNILFFFLCLVVCTTSYEFDNNEIERELKLLNKAPVKSIHTTFGYIVDCIDINNQPAFDHPLLINHKLQKNPSFQTKFKKNSVKNSATKAVFGLQNVRCPIGTVPIKRTTKDDLIRQKIYFNNGLVENLHGNHYAEVIAVEGYYKSFYGISGTNNVYSVKVNNDQSSSSVMFVRNGPDSTNYVGMGWHVAPQLYNNDETHFYAVWTKDNFKNTGCFNLLCSGFVQTSKANYLGGQFPNTSIHGGPYIEIAMSITQDPKTKNWWLSNENEMIGYFPASLFSNLTSAGQVGWGGRTSTSKGAPSPPMGSGLFPDNNFNHASYFKDISFQNDSTKSYGPEEYSTKEFADKPNCYFAKYYGKDREVGFSLQFGGPGGNCGD